MWPRKITVRNEQGTEPAARQLHRRAAGCFMLSSWPIGDSLGRMNIEDRIIELARPQIRNTGGAFIKGLSMTLDIPMSELHAILRAMQKSGRIVLGTDGWDGRPQTIARVIR